MNNSVSSPINPFRIIVNLEETEPGFLDLVDENSVRLAQTNPEVFPAALETGAVSSIKTRTFVRGGTSTSIRPASRMSSGGDGDPVRSALAPRTSEAVNSVRVEKKYGTTKNVVYSALSSPLSEGPRRRGASTPPRPNITQQPLRPIDADRSRIPKHERDSKLSPKVRPASGSVASQKSFRSAPVQVPPPASDWHWDPDSQEQALFEQRLCEDAYGVAVRKINQNGKAQLRYVKCVPVSAHDDDNASTSKSVSSLVRSFSLRSRDKRRMDNDDNSDTDKLLSDSRKALVWGKKREHMMPIEQFVSVRVGKTTDRTRRNPQPASRLLSILTKDGSLDIEAPTRLDRDKFAQAFARFLRVPLEDPVAQEGHTVALSVPDLEVIGISPDLQGKKSARPSPVRNGSNVPLQSNDDFDAIPLSRNASCDEGAFDVTRSQNASSSATSPMLQGKEFIASGPVISGFSPDLFKTKDDKSDVSSLTGGNYDQDIVEELHNALEGLKTELAESRAEASRAVKVAEQAIQSAENSSSKDWNSTVTHKAAEAAALAQKRSAEAIAKQRLAEERLFAERKNAVFWRKQAESAEEEAGVLQTRAAAAEVQRASMNEELQCERERTTHLIETLKNRFDKADTHQREALDAALGRSRALEIELTSTRSDLSSKRNETNPEDYTVEASQQVSIRRKVGLLGKPKKRNLDSADTTSLLSFDQKSSDTFFATEPSGIQSSLPAEDVLKLHAEFTAIRLQFELLKRTTSEELKTLPETAELFATQTSAALAKSQAEVSRLQQRLALESCTRRKLLHEVQDLRGNIRVFCRPRPFEQHGTSSLNGALSFPSNEILALHRERLPSSTDLSPLSFEFDRIFSPEMGQRDVYAEIDELILCALDGYKVCLMAYGQSGTGKTFTMLGDVTYLETNGSVEISKYGFHLLGLEQLFNVVEHRRDRYEDHFTLSIVEVSGEKLCDLIAGTSFSEGRGVENLTSTTELKSSKASRRSEDEAYSQISSKSRKLDIRTSGEGETYVKGVITVNVSSLDEAVRLWKEVLSHRSSRLKELGNDLEAHEIASHLIATLRIVSTNIATGVGTQGKIQFVDFAGADLIRTSSKPKHSKSIDDIMAPVGNNFEWKYTSKSLSTFLDVISARSKFERDVPYRNSTLTHLLQDALEGDTKVMMMLCVSSDPKHMQETASALRLATKVKKIVIGKATRHAIQRATTHLSQSDLQSSK